ncbi:ammonium transporter Rh type A-like [Uloborus diversus]|uniref:ammonium transporter Rh type A-like n=1 Tax=Uloborus diversus TaxID=327109 RepID=UPI00240A6307|nr:ammonium transporter Rh type A-like [Uloborus diversus]
MLFQSGKFATLVLCLEIAFIIIYAFVVTYEKEADVIRANSTIKDVDNRNTIEDYYAMFQDVNVMIFIGFGFLMTFMKKYGYSAVGLNFLLAAISIQWAIIMQGVWKMQNGKIPINITNLINGNFASATVLISYGALLGKASPLQLVVMSIIEIAIFGCNEHLGVHIFKAADIGGSIFLHTFGAYFGLAVSYMLYRKDFNGSSKEGANYHSDIFAMIGTIFLWLFWPSFNSAMAVGSERHRSVINTFAALLASCVTTFSISSLIDEEGRLSMVHIQNATLAGGVAIGCTSNMILHPFGSMIVGALAGTISTAGYRALTPFLSKKLRIHDTCGVNNLHGMPGVFAGLVSAVVASIANEDSYGLSLYSLYPARSPLYNSTEFHRLHSLLPELEPGAGWTEASQAYAQLEALFTTMAVAICGGVVTGYIIRHRAFNPPKLLQLYDDNDYWEVPDD